MVSQEYINQEQNFNYKIHQVCYFQIVHNFQNHIEIVVDKKRKNSLKIFII